MARKPSNKKNEQAPIEKEETPVEVEASAETPNVEVEAEQAPVETKEVTPVVSDSNHTKASFAEVIARYKEQNPAKYEEKKDVLLAKLNALK